MNIFTLFLFRSLLRVTLAGTSQKEPLTKKK